MSWSGYTHQHDSKESAIIQNYNGCEHLRPVLEALLAAGNSVNPHPNAVGPFRPSQGGMYCPLIEPIDFGVIAAVPHGPEVTFAPDDDSVFCRPCWLPVFGGEHARRSIENWERATGKRFRPKESTEG